MPLKLFVVDGLSMAPALKPGDGLVGVRTRRPRVGQVIVVRRPTDGLWLVKRVAGVAGDVVEIDGQTWQVGPGTVFALSDDPESTTTDSRRYGPLSLDGAYRMIARVPRRWVRRKRR